MKVLRVAILLFAVSGCFAQGPAAVEERPLPDIATLMKQVEANQKTAEDAQKDYIYKSAIRFEKLDGKGDVKKTQSQVDEIFWLNNVQMVRLLEKDGKPLSPDEAKKENERIDKEAIKIREKRDKAAAEGKQTDSRGNVIAPLSRYLQLVTLSRPRREFMNGRPTIKLDFVGDANAKTYNAPEKFVKELAGTLWIDENDKVVARLDAHFVNAFKLGGGLLVNVTQGTQFTLLARKINDEVWLPDSIKGTGHVRAFLVFAAEGDFALQTSDYRKFKTSSKIMPAFTPMPDTPMPYTPMPDTPMPDKPMPATKE